MTNKQHETSIGLILVPVPGFLGGLFSGKGGSDYIHIYICYKGKHPLCSIEVLGHVWVGSNFKKNLNFFNAHFIAN